MSTVTDRLLLLITGDASGAVRAFGEVGAAGKKAAVDAEKSSTAAGSALEKFGITTGVAVAAGATVAGAAIAKFALDGVEHFTALTAQVRGFQRVTGATAEQSSQLVAAFSVLGVDADRAGTAIFRLAHNLDGNAQKLAAYGVQVAHTADGNVDLANTFLNIADAASKAGAGQQADAIASAAFGARVAKDLLPVLLRGREGLQELFAEAAKHHEIFSQADLEKGRQLTLATNELRQAFAGLQVEAGQALVPAITGLVGATEKVVEFTDKVGRAAVSLHLFDPLRSALHAISGDAKSAGTDLAAMAKQAADAAAKATNQIAAEHSAIDGLAGAAKSYRSANQAVADAEKALSDARDEVAKKAQDQADATDQATKATADLAQAETDLIAAQNRAPADLAKNRRDLADATLKVEQADQDALIAATKYGKGSLAAREAVQAVTDAQGDQADAAQKVAEAEAAGGRTKDVLDAEDRIASAKKAQAEAAQAKTKADAEDPTADILKAEQGIKDAEDERLTVYGKLVTAIGTFNDQTGKSVTLQDVLNGKVQEMLNNYNAALNAQAALKVDALVPYPLPPGTLGPPHYGPELVPQALPPGALGPPTYGPPGSGTPAGPFLSSAGNQLVIQNFNVTTPASAQDIADELGFLMRRVS